MDRLDALVVSPVPWGDAMGAGAQQDAYAVAHAVVVAARSAVVVRGVVLMVPEPG